MRSDEPTLPTETLAPRYVAKQTVDVVIEGAVKAPGSYQLQRGATIGNLFDLAEPLPDADLRGFKRTTKLKDGRVVTIRKKKRG